MNPLILLKVSLLLSVVLVAARLLYRAPAATRHGLWSLAFGAMLLLAPLAAALPAIYVPVPAVWKTAVSSQRTPAVTAGLTIVGPEPSAASRSEALTSTTSLSQPHGASNASLPDNWPGLTTLFLFAWLAGVIAATVTVLVSLFRVWRLVRTAEVVSDPVWTGAAAAIGRQLGLRYRVRLLLSDRVSTPMAGGVWRPAVFMPLAASSWSAEHRDLVLAHELAHLAGRDPLRHLLTRLALACYWFHPLAWIAAREAAIAREQACDEAVLAMGARPSAYARVLLDLAESISARPPARFLGALPMVHRSHLEKRLMAILNVDARPSTRRLVLGPAIGVALLTLSVAAAQPALSMVEGPFDGAQGKPFEITPIVPVQTTVSAVEVARFAEEHARPFAETYARPFAETQARPFAETQARPFAETHARPVAEALAKAFSGSPLTTEAAPIEPQRGRDSTCWADSGYGGNFTGSSSSSQVGGRTVIYDQVGWRDGDRIIQRSFGDLRICMLAEGAGDRTGVERPSQWIGRSRRVVIEAHRGNTVQRLEFNGTSPSWQVNGSNREFDAAGQTWRDRMLAVLDTTWEVSSLRGEVSALRGQISSIHGQRSSLQGEISALGGNVSAMRGRISSVQGQESSLRGQISAIRGHLSALQGAISAQHGAISSLSAGRYGADAADRSRIASRIADHDAAISRIEREIRDYDAERRIAAVQREIDSFDADGKASSIERQIRDFDLEGKVAAIQRRITDLDVEGKVNRIERQIDALDADRRARQLEDRRDSELSRLNTAITTIR